jgi:16S rRNA (cytidine1402-2'-O)-methyltransferase
MDKRQVFCNDRGTLYLIATPIGNLSDISSRTKETLDMVDYLLCEDTRNTIKLLDYLGIKKQMFSYHKFNEKEMVSKVLKDLEDGKNIGLVSDAGYPGISDPGYIVSREAITASCNVTCIGGPSAFIHALVCSGIDSAHFMFYGFLDSKQVARTKELESLVNVKETLIFYETSNRMNESLLDMKKVFGNRRFCVARELTKKYEEFIYGNLEEVDGSNVDVKGECVVIVEGNNNEDTSLNTNVVEVIEEMLDNGIRAKDVAKMLSKVTNISKNEIYDFIVKNYK